MQRALPAIAVLLAAPLLGGASDPGSLTITVDGIRNSRGALLACVFRDKAGFPTCQKSKTAIRQRLAIGGAAMTVRFPDLAPGVYAVTVQHDEDGDGKLKTNFIGIPKEGVGVSNNPGGIPNWGKAVFRVRGAANIAVTMRYI